MGGEEHSESPSWASGQACGNIILMDPVSHQLHQELVSPGDAKGWREALVPSPETQNGCWCWYTPPHPSVWHAEVATLTPVTWAQTPGPPPFLSPEKSK